MILFCEDCGGKNDLGPRAFSQGRAVFKCSLCGYANSYPVNFPLEEPDSQPPFLTRLVSFQEVAGAFIFHGEKGVVDMEMPAFLTREDVFTLGRALARSLYLGKICCPDIRAMTVMIHDKYFFVYKRGQLYVVVVAVKKLLPKGVLSLLKDLEE